MKGPPEQLGIVLGQKDPLTNSRQREAPHVPIPDPNFKLIIDASKTLRHLRRNSGKWCDEGGEQPGLDGYPSCHIGERRGSEIDCSPGF